jgi:hypothetical protein
MEQVPHHHGGLARERVAQRSEVVDHAILENYYDRKTAAPPRGPIELQTHGGEIRWRNIFIREIGSDEANKILADAWRRRCVQERLERQGFRGLGRAGGEL